MKNKTLALLAALSLSTALPSLASAQNISFGDFYAGFSFTPLVSKGEGAVLRYRQRTGETSPSLDQTIASDYNETDPLMGLTLGWRQDLGQNFMIGAEIGVSTLLNSKRFNDTIDIAFDGEIFSIRQLNANPSLNASLLGGVYIDQAKDILVFGSLGLQRFSVDAASTATFDDGKPGKTKFVPAIGVDYKMSEAFSVRLAASYMNWEEKLTQATNVDPVDVPVPGSDTLIDTVSYSDLNMTFKRSSFATLSLIFNF